MQIQRTGSAYHVFNFRENKTPPRWLTFVRNVPNLPDLFELIEERGHDRHIFLGLQSQDAKAGRDALGFADRQPVRLALV